jgi:RES domain-containing protein
VIAWRLSSSLYPALSGEGAKRVGGRWNSPGVSLVYASESLSLSVLEVLVHLESEDLPDNLQATRVELPDDSVEARVDVPPAWLRDPLMRQSRRFGDAWVGEGRSVALVVPSAVIPAERNVLLNPRHPRFAEVRMVEQHPFRLDARLRP